MKGIKVANTPSLHTSLTIISHLGAGKLVKYEKENRYLVSSDIPVASPPHVLFCFVFFGVHCLGLPVQ